MYVLLRISAGGMKNIPSMIHDQWNLSSNVWTERRSSKESFLVGVWQAFCQCGYVKLKGSPSHAGCFALQPGRPRRRASFDPEGIKSLNDLELFTQRDLDRSVNHGFFAPRGANVPNPHSTHALIWRLYSPLSSVHCTR